MRVAFWTSLLGCLFVAGVTPARADATAFVGMNTTTAPHPTVGVAVGRCCPGMVGFEVEYAGIIGAADPETTNLSTVTVNFLVQRSLNQTTAIYVIGGIGGHIVANDTADNVYDLGGGAKVALMRALALRIDYRPFRLRRPPSAKPLSPSSRRLAAGVSVLF